MAQARRVTAKPESEPELEPQRGDQDPEPGHPPGWRIPGAEKLEAERVIRKLVSQLAEDALGDQPGIDLLDQSVSRAA